MKKKFNVGYMLLGAIVLFIVVATVTNADVSGALTYAQIEGATCSDSDNGRYYFEEGSVSYGDMTYEDYCYDHDTVVENYCTPIGEAADVMFNCAYGCTNGACISSTERSALSV